MWGVFVKTFDFMQKNSIKLIYRKWIFFVILMIGTSEISTTCKYV